MSSRWWVFLVVGALLVSPVLAGKKPPDPEELFNPFLGVEWSTWLSGPISWIATDQEIEDFQLLTTDEEAEAFAKSFWDRRAEGVGPFDKTPEQLFDERAEIADSRYSEGAWPGRVTDRGTVLIVYGEPEEIEYESAEKVGHPPQEVWRYAKDSEKGLDGEKPERKFRFVTLDGKTVFWDSRAKLDSQRRLPRRDRWQ